MPVSVFLAQPLFSQGGFRTDYTPGLKGYSLAHLRFTELFKLGPEISFRECLCHAVAPPASRRSPRLARPAGALCCRRSGSRPRSGRLLNWVTALSMAQRAINEDGDDPWAHLAAGYVHVLARRFKPAIEQLTEAVDRNFSFAHAHMAMGTAYAY